MSSAMNSTTPPAAGDEQVELAISGMTCASCAMRIEKRLNKLDGVTATVNYATEKARVSYADGVSPEDLVAAVAEVVAAGVAPVWELIGLLLSVLVQGLRSLRAAWLGVSGRAGRRRERAAWPSGSPPVRGRRVTGPGGSRRR